MTRRLWTLGRYEAALLLLVRVALLGLHLHDYSALLPYSPPLIVLLIFGP
jgi:hypothetical protein